MKVNRTNEILEGYTRVTEVLWPFSGLTQVDEYVLESACRRGTRVHQICEAIVEGVGNWDVDESIQGYVHSFEKWWKLGHTVVSVEERFYCDYLKITGQVDMIVQNENGYTIVDIKTSSKPSKTWALQGSAYAYMARKQGYDITSIQFLQLNKNGMNPTIYTYDDQLDLFKSTLEVYDYFFRTTRTHREKNDQ